MRQRSKLNERIAPMAQRGWCAAACAAVVVTTPAAADVVPFYAFCDLRPADPALDALVQLRSDARLSFDDSLFREGLKQLPIGTTFQSSPGTGSASETEWLPEEEPIFVPEPVLDAAPAAAPPTDDAWFAGPRSLASVSF